MLSAEVFPYRYSYFCYSEDIDTIKQIAMKIWRIFKQLTQLGFPKDFPIIQFPNLPLILAFLAGIVSKATSGTTHDYFLAIVFVGMVIWAFEELVYGVNWFRHLLGATYIVILVMRIAHAIHS